MTETLTIVINRGDNSMATSFLVWGKWKAYPQCDGDGVFVGEIEIGPDEEQVIYEWDTPNGQTNWRFIAIPKYLDQIGLPGQLEPA